MKFPYHVNAFAREATDLRSLMAVIEEVANTRDAAMINGGPRLGDPKVKRLVERKLPLRRTGKLGNGGVATGCFEQVSRYNYMADFDCHEGDKERNLKGYEEWCQARGLDVFEDPEGAIRAVVDEFFPPIFRSVSFGYQLSASAGIKNNST
jgi:hypothetical protein